MSVKSLLLQTLASNRTKESISPTQCKRLLVLRYDRIGDLITTLPALLHVHNMFPDMEIDVLASEANAGMVQNLPFIHYVHVVPNRSLKHLLPAAWSLKKYGYDAIFCAVFNKTTESLLLSRVIGGKQVMTISPWRGEKYRGLFSVYASEVQPPYHWNMMMDALSLAFKIPTGPVPGAVGALLQKSTVVENPIDGVYAIVNISAGIPERQWSNRVVIDLVTWCLANLNVKIVVTGMPVDVKSVRALAQERFSAERVYWDTGHRSLRQLSLLYANASFVFTPDTGMVHLCGLFNVPLFVAYATEHSANIWPAIVEVQRSFIANRPTSTISFEEIKASVEEFCSLTVS